MKFRFTRERLIFGLMGAISPILMGLCITGLGAIANDHNVPTWRFVATISATLLGISGMTLGNKVTELLRELGR